MAPPPFGLKRFLIARKRAFGIFGAAIVFLTFIVKEGLRENARDSAEAVEKAEMTTSQALIAERIAVAVEETRVFSGVLYGNTVEKSPLGRDLIELVVSFKRAQLQAERAATSIDAVRELINSLPNGLGKQSKISRVEEFQNLQKALAAELEAVESFGDDGYRDITRNPLSPAEMGTLSGKVSKLWSQASELNGRLSDLIHNTLDQARQTRERNAVFYKWFKYASYALFGIGWTLATIGHVLGVDEPNSEGA